ncbi:MAG: M20/M25/M40 family metallo-hydrolase [Bryobacteraceae bacterium]|nr:M20/M25/M40 family metallo-hydrolase [Bryobacteraceae bacterium]
MRRRDLLRGAPALVLVGRARAAAVGDYEAVARRLIDAALADRGGWAKLEHLCDRIGPRLSGSKALELAIEWCAGTMRREGLENVVTPPVQVPVWVRGNESAWLVEPRQARLAMLGLGGSVGTPPEGITAEAVCVDSFEELERLGEEKVRGRIVVYNQAWRGYRETVAYRSTGASRAARLGARAVLLRSVTPAGLRTPHTGALNYAADAPKIPAAAISIEDALMIRRLQDAGVRVTVRLLMEAAMLEDARSANVIGEIPGRERPEEVVVMGGHLDSWDVGQGAQDDASGCVATWQAVQVVKSLGLRPRRTLRVCLWTNEENGLRGGRAYREWVGNAVRGHVAAIEMDGGAEKLRGFGLSIQGAPAAAYEQALARMEAIAALMRPLGPVEIVRGGGGADIGPLMREGVPGIAHLSTGRRYFEWHHTEADTLDKIDRREFQEHIAALAVLGYVLADMEERLAEEADSTGGIA